jgi:formylmethanofuran dehydrogenase subunit E
MMNDTVECPYCEHENDMSDGTVDLPSDNKFDHECSKCGEQFEVEVEFEPSYWASKIVYVSCEKCGQETRDPATQGTIFPWPKSIKEKVVCRPCFYEGHRSE